MFRLATTVKEFLVKRVLVACCVSLLSLLLWTQQAAAKNPAVGRWNMDQPGVGKSELKITEKDGRLEVQEIGLGEVRSTIASYEDGLLLIHWQNPATDLQGYWLLHLNKEHNRGEGKSVFTRSREDFKPGKEQKILDRTVRVVEGVTVSRIKE
jgi:hypothetical protein